MEFPKKVCCITKYHDGDPETTVRVTMVTTDMLLRDKVVAHMEWWVKDIELDDIYGEVDYLAGVLRDNCPSAYIMLVQETAALVRVPTGYLSSYVTRQDLLTLMREEPDKFLE